jgi:acyl-CoA synthetase (AMP-forming)/AMP-acid ligase II/acyl carrier protein
MTARALNGTTDCHTLIDLLHLRRATTPNRLAFTFLSDGEQEGARVSYGELDRQARAIAAWLCEHGSAGERVLLLYPPGLDYIAAFFGCLYAGMVAVPALPPRPNRPMPRLEGMVVDAGVRLALASSDILANIERRFTHAPYLRDLHWLDIDHLPTGIEDAWQEPAICSDSLAFLQYTSGSTAAPRGVMLSHANLLHNLALINRCFEAGPDCRCVFWLPPYHDMGMIGGILQPLYAGAADTVLMPPAAFLQRPLRWLEAISRTQATVSGAPNFAYDLCASRATREQIAALDLSTWKLAFTGAEPIRPETLDRFAEVFAPCGFRKEAFYPCYGLAEATLLVTGSNVSTAPVRVTVDAAALAQNDVRQVADEVPGRELVSSGRSPVQQDVRIVDPETLRICPPSRVGEIWVKGPSVADGYWRRPEETARTFQATLADDESDGPYLRTGDLGFLLDRELFVTGRAKDLIILQGKNHYPQDIERTVEESHPAVAQGSSAAFAIEAAGRERLVVVAEVEREHRNKNLDSTLTAVRQAVATHHDVAVWSVVLIRPMSIPKTSSGKIQRHACREQFLADSLEVVAEWTDDAIVTSEEWVVGSEEIQDNNSPHSLLPTPHSSLDTGQSRSSQEIQAWLIGEIAQRLKIPVSEVDPCQLFASLGMDSLTTMMLAGDLETWLGRRLAPTLLYDLPNIEAISRELADGTAGAEQQEPSPVEPIEISMCMYPWEAALDGPCSIDRQAATELLGRLDQLSGEEMTDLLRLIRAGEASVSPSAA